MYLLSCGSSEHSDSLRIRAVGSESLLDFFWIPEDAIFKRTTNTLIRVYSCRQGRLRSESLRAEKENSLHADKGDSDQILFMRTRQTQIRITSCGHERLRSVTSCGQILFMQPSKTQIRVSSCGQGKHRLESLHADKEDTDQSSSCG